MKYRPITKVYVAAASTEIDRASTWMRRLTDAGFEVVSTWPKLVEEVGAANPRDASREQRCGWSNRDLAEIDEAGTFWLLVPPTAPGRGAYLELGVAIGQGGKKLVASGDTKQSIFLGLTTEFENDLDAFIWIVARAKEEADRAAASAREVSAMYGGRP